MVVQNTMGSPATPASLTGAWIQVLTALSLTLYPSNMPGKAAIGGLSLCLCHPCGRLRWSSWLLAYAWTSPAIYDHLGSEPVDANALPFSLLPCHSNEVKHKIFFKRRGICLTLFLPILLA